MVNVVDLGKNLGDPFARSSFVDRTPLESAKASCHKLVAQIRSKGPSVTDGDEAIRTSVCGILDVLNSIDKNDKSGAIGDVDVAGELLDAVEKITDKAVVLVTSNKPVEDDKHGLAYDISSVLQVGRLILDEGNLPEASL